MIALVGSGQADVGVGDFTATMERSHVVDFIDTVEFSRQVRLVLFHLSPFLSK
jgi:hypothetical protein